MATPKQSAHSFDQYSTGSDSQFEDCTTNHHTNTTSANQYAYYDYLNHYINKGANQRPQQQQNRHQDYMNYNFNQNYNQKYYRPMYQQHLKYDIANNFSNDICTNYYLGFSENDFCYDYKRRLRNMLHDVTPPNEQFAEPYAHDVYEQKMKSLKKNFKPIFKKNCTKNYVSYNQILEYFN